MIIQIISDSFNDDVNNVYTFEVVPLHSTPINTNSFYYLQNFKIVGKLKIVFDEYK